ncbi:MAG: hypothetical protein II839_06210 [Kiritimatiellae bacterium]|nr:hypothetical protein [Kiritimatiellia bacterium]
MKRFLAKLALLALLAAALSVALALCAYPGKPPARFGPEVFRAIRVCSEARPDAKVLVLGDSVANQIFATGPAMPASVAVATCNQAVTPLGNRLLLDRWLALNPQAEEVVYVALPGSFRNDGARKHTFHYFIHPFSETGLLRSAPAEVRDHLAARFGRAVLDNASLRHLLYRNDRLYQFYEERIVRIPSPGGGMPDVAVGQIRAMKEACDRVGVRFRLAFPPVSAEAAPSAAYRASCVEALRDVVPGIEGLFDGLRVEPKTDFKDGVHFTRERLAKVQESLRRKILAGAGGVGP